MWIDWGKKQKGAELAELQVSVASLEPHDKDGFLTKQGGAIKTWKRRWFVLKGNKLWYFKTKTDTVAKGFIELEATTLIRDESATSKKKKPMFSIQARGVKGRRVFMIIPDTQQESLEWIQAIRLNIKACASGGFEKPAQDTGSSYPGNTGGLLFSSFTLWSLPFSLFFSFPGTKQFLMFRANQWHRT